MLRNFTYILVLGAVFFSVQSYGQLAPYYTHYMLNKLAYNPATAGEKDAICVNALSHSQWIGQDDQSTEYKAGIGTKTERVNPSTQAFSITAPLFNNKLGIGFQVVNDKIGYSKALYFRGSAAYKFAFGRRIPYDNKQGFVNDQVLAVGADFGMVQIGLDGTKYNPLQTGDPQIPNTLVNGSSFDMGFGVYYSNQSLFNGFYAGASMSHLTSPTVSVAGLIDFRVERYFQVLAGSEHSFGAVSLLPSILVRTQGGAGLQVDMTGRLKFGDKLVAGAGLRSRDAIYLMAGYYIQRNFYVGYSYDVQALSGITDYTRAGTHEIFASFCFELPTKSEDPPRRRYNVRYLEGYSVY